MSLTSVIRYARALDSSATDGSGKTGLAFGDVTAKYLTQGGPLTSLTTETITTLGTYQAPTSAAHIRIKELNNSDPCKGTYEVHFHNTQMVDTGKKLWLFLSASGAAFTPLEVELIAQTGDSYAIVNDSSFGNAKLVRSTTPANTLTVDSNHLVAVPDTQKVDVNTIKTQSVTCGAGVTVLASVGTAATSTAQTGDAYAVVNSVTFGNSALNTAIAAVNTKTTNLPSDPADASDIAAAFSSLQTHGDSTWSTITAAAVRSAVGLASANLDTQIDAIPTANENADAYLDRANAIETGLTPRGATRLIVAANAGKLSGAESSSVVIRNVGDSKNRITATVDSNGNRTTVTTDAT